MTEQFQIAMDWSPGVVGDIVALHGRYYAQRWGFGPYFEAKVATELADFIRSRHLHASRLWRVMGLDQRVLGSVAIDGRHGVEDRAHLRWFILDRVAQGQGLGARLLDAALGFSRDSGFPGVELWTFEGLNDARRLYESRGFRLVEERSGETWGKPVTEQRFRLDLKGAGVAPSL